MFLAFPKIVIKVFLGAHGNVGQGYMLNHEIEKITS